MFTVVDSFDNTIDETNILALMKVRVPKHLQPSL